MDFNREINKHLEWIEAVASLIGADARPEDDIKEVSRHDHCALGRWLSSDESADFKGFPEFESLEKSHATFHALAGELISALEEGNEHRADELQETFIATSQEVIAYLEALREHEGSGT